MIEKPLIYTYINGASVLGLGGYGGRPESEICSMLTNVPSRHWDLHPQECDALITSRIRSYEVLCGFLAYMALLSFLAFKSSTSVISGAHVAGKFIVSHTWTFLSLTAGAASSLLTKTWRKVSELYHPNVIPPAPQTHSPTPQAQAQAQAQPQPSVPCIPEIPQDTGTTAPTTIKTTTVAPLTAQAKPNAHSTIIIS